MPESVAIIMRAFNEMPYAERALEMLHRQTFGGFRLYAVDSGSTDGTVQALEKYGADLTQIRPDAYVPGKVLNDAVSRASEAIIVLLNADAVPQSADWLEQLILPLMENRADATFSKQVARPDAAFIVDYDYQRAYNPEKTAPGFFSAVACAFKRELWEKHPFRSEGYAEDAAWAKTCHAEGARFQLEESSVVEHSHNYTLRELAEKKRRQARALSKDGYFKPSLPAQTYVCLREIVRDFLYALRRFKLHTIPYNIAYRITIHRAIYRGQKEP